MKRFGFRPALSCVLTVGCLMLISGHLLAQQGTSSEGIHPVSWLTLRSEIRARGEASSNIDFEPGHQHIDALSRVRFSADITPFSWLRFHTELQDSRPFAGAHEDLRDGSNALDFRHAYVDLGAPEGSKWSLRVGRLPLEIGDERLIGSDNYWCNLSRRFDGAHAKLAVHGWNWDIFAATVAPLDSKAFDRPSLADRVSGLYGSLAGKRGTIEPFLFMTKAVKVLDVDPVNVANWTPGVHITLPLPQAFTLDSQTILQYGRAAGHPVSAWAGAWQLSRPLGPAETSPLLSASYSFASGDRNPQDRRRGTFDDLYPSGFNGCGFLEPFAWRNLRDASVAAEWSPIRGWTFNTEMHSYWLAAKQDGLYVDEGASFRFNPDAASSHVGAQFNATAYYKPNPRWELGVGYARFFAGAYLRETGDGIGSNRIFLAWTLRM